MNTTVWSNSSMSPVVPNVSIFVRSLPQMRLIYQRMLYWVPLTVLLPGIVLNTLMACVFTRKRFWKNTTMGFYYTVHPICSNIALVSLYILFHQTLNYNLNILKIVGMVAFLPSALGINLTSDLISCNFLISMRVVSIVGVEYFTVMMTIDRMVNILYPRRFPWLSKTRNLFKMTIGVYIVVFIYGFATQSLRSMTYTYVTVNNTTQVATATCNYLSNTVAASVNVSVCLVRVGGFVIIQIANTFIVRRLVVSKRVLRSSNLTPGNNQRISSKEFYFCMSLMAYNLIRTSYK